MTGGQHGAGCVSVLIVLLLLGASAHFVGLIAPQAMLRAQTASVPVTLTSPNSQSYGEFGASVAISGSYVVVGAFDETVGGVEGAGRVYIYSTTGSLLTTLTNPNPQLEGFFGDAVAISAKDVVVGADGEMVGGVAWAGRAYIFSTTGSLLANLTSPNSQKYGEFGTSVAISGSDVVVGAHIETVDGASWAGRVYIFSTTGSLLATLTSPNSQVDGLFGTSVAISGNDVAVGAYNETVNGASWAGRAYIFSTSGSLLATLTSPNSQQMGMFGYSVAISGKDVVVSAHHETVNGLWSAGRAYIFSTTGSLLATLTSPNLQAGGVFGYSVGISGNDVVVGADSEEGVGTTDAGHAYVFNTAGSILANLTSPNPRAGGFFGNSIAASGSDVVVGAYRETASGGTEAGNAYVLALPTSTSTSTSANDLYIVGGVLAAVVVVIIVGMLVVMRGRGRPPSAPVP